MSLPKFLSRIRVTSNSQAVGDVEQSHDRLIHVLERLQAFFLRLERYIEGPLSSGFQEFLGRIMAQIFIIILPLEKAKKKRWRISELIILPRPV